MSNWLSTKAQRVLAALQRIGWTIKRQTASHKTLAREGYPDFVFAFHDGEEISPKMLSRIAKYTGLKPADIEYSFCTAGELNSIMRAQLHSISRFSFQFLRHPQYLF